jgi:hypothetical protein
MYTLLFFGQFLNVFLLGLNSQYVRDRRKLLCFVVSWGISTSQFVYIWIIANTEDPLISFFVSGFGGACGIVCSITLYEKLENIKRKGNEKNKQSSKGL